MKKYWVNKLLFLVLLFIISKGYGQLSPSRNISVRDGLPSNKVYDVLRSHSGALWVATENGITEVRGQRMNTFTEKNGIPHNNCWQVLEDEKGTIWVGTYGGGIAYLEGDTFIAISELDGLVHNSVRKLFHHENNLFVGTQNGVSVVNTTTKEVKNYQILHSRLQVMDFFVFNESVYCVGYKHGTYQIGEERLIKVNADENVFCAKLIEDTLFYSKDGNTEGRNSVYKIGITDFLSNKPLSNSYGNSVIWDFEMVNGKILAAAWGVNIASGGVFDVTNDKTKSLSELHGVNSKAVYHIDYNQTIGQLLVCTLDMGLFLIDLSESVLSYPKAGLKFHFPIDKNNEIFGFSDRIEVRQNEQLIRFQKKDFLSFAFTQLNENYLTRQIETDISLRQFSLKNIRNFAGFSITEVTPIAGIFYVNTTVGLFRFRARNDSFDFDQYFPLSTISGFHFNDKKELFVQTPYASLKRLNLEKGSLFSYSFDLKNSNNPRDIIQFVEIGSTLFGVSRFKGIYLLQSDTFVSLLQNKKIEIREFVKAFKNSENSFLLADYLGNIYQVLLANEQVSFEKIIDSELIKGQTVVGLSQYEGKIIVGTNVGLTIFDLTTEQTMFLDEEQGFAGKEMINIQLKDSVLFLTCEDALATLNLSNYLLNRVETILFISSMKANGEKKTISKSQPILLDHFENELEFELGGVDIKYPEKVYFSYRIKGLENNDWSELISYHQTNKISLPFVPSGHYQLEVKFIDEYNGIRKILILSEFQIKSPFWQNPFFYLFVCSLFVFIIYIGLKKNFNRKTKIQRERANLEMKVSEAKLEALKSQMNPHFVFNSLNAIQNFVIENDIDSSLSYMNSFASLMRKSLDYSSRKEISLKEEIEFLKLFVKIQNLRFGNKVEFKVQKSKDIRLSETVIPPMILQPILENCFEHAFDQEIEQPFIAIDFQVSVTSLIVTIRDNGIGFDVQPKESSKGLKLISERLSLLNSKNRLSVSSNSSGTEINIVFHARLRE